MENRNEPQSNELQGDEANQDRWCFCYYGGDEQANFKEKAILLKSAKWQPGDIITISFLNGNPKIHEKVIASAMKWIEVAKANLTFQFRLDTNDTNIRISFDRPGSWSVLGTTCKTLTDLNEPTMNFGWLNEETSDEDIDRVVLHEFGHAIGMIHEHMRPPGDIKWNRAQVIKDLSGPPNNWSLATIENNMFRTFDKDELVLTRLDKNSIMMYPIPSKWTIDGFSAGLNTTLSPTDIKFVREVYPGRNDF